MLLWAGKAWEGADQGTMGLVWEVWAVAFLLCSQEKFPWHPDADLATSVNGDIVWESLSPSLSPGRCGETSPGPGPANVL